MTPEPEWSRAKLRADLRNAVYRAADAHGWPVVVTAQGTWLTTADEWASVTANCPAAELYDLAATMVDWPG